MSKCPQCGRELPAPGSACPVCAANPSSAEPSQPTPLREMLPTVTIVLIAINVLLFAAMVLRGVSVTHPTTDQLVHWGANFGPLTLGGQWWRLLSSMFLHIGIVHLLVNMWCFFQMGVLAERLYRPTTYVWLYLLSGLAGALASLARNPVVVSAGASGAIFGVAGGLITTIYFGKLPIPKRALSATLRSLLIFAGFNLAYGFWDKQIDNGAHVGGLICGLVLGFLFSHDALPTARRWSFRPLVVPVLLLVMVASAWALQRSNVSLVHMERMRVLLARRDSAGALRELQLLLQKKPDYAPAYASMGDIYVLRQQPKEAEQAYGKALQLDPKNVVVETDLGALYLASQQPEKAREAFAKAIQINPKYAIAYRNLGFTLQQMGQTAAAMDAYQHAIALRPDDVLALYNYGLLAMSSKQYDKAVASFQKASQLEPNDAEILTWLANAYQAKGMNKEADAAFAKAYVLRRKRQPQPRVPR